MRRAAHSRSGGQYWWPEAGPRRFRAHLIAGDTDVYCGDVARQLQIIFAQRGIRANLDEYSDLEHTFPADFQKHLVPVLNGLVQD